VLPTSILGSSLGFIDSSVVNVALPKVQSELGVGFEASQWVANAYLLTLASLILFGGSVGDTIGQRRTFILGLSGFAAASIACGLAPTAAALVVFRGVQGAAGALLIPASLALVGTAFSGEDRGRAVGTWAAAGALTTALGPPLGGWLVDVVGWRSVFFLNAPIAAAALAMAIQVRPDRPDRGGSLEFLSPILGVLCLGSASYGLIEAGTEASSRGAAFTLLALPLGALLVWRERRASHPVLPPRLFGDRRFVVANALTAVLYAALTGSLFLLPFILISTYGYSAAGAGAAFLPFSAIMAAGSRTAGTFAQRVGSRAMLAAGSLVTASGYAVLALSAARPEYWLGFLPGLVLTGIGMTACVAPLTTVVLDAAPCDLGGSASGVNNAAARLGGLVAVAALGFAFGSAFASALASVAVVEAYRRVMWTATALAVVAALMAIAWLGDDPPERRGSD
jgi:EmrB/QacA subfamily drug resistance transporter